MIKALEVCKTAASTRIHTLPESGKGVSLPAFMASIIELCNRYSQYPAYMSSACQPRTNPGILRLLGLPPCSLLCKPLWQAILNGLLLMRPSEECCNEHVVTDKPFDPVGQCTTSLHSLKRALFGILSHLASIQ